jgi:transposase
MHVRDKLSEREIARMTGLSRNTVCEVAARRRLPMAHRSTGAKRSPNKLSAFHEATLKQALTADARRAKHERRTATCAAHRDQGGAGYDGGYSAGH